MEDGLKRNQRAAARQLSLAAYLIGGEGQAKDEAQIRNRIPFYEELMEVLLDESEPAKAHASFGRQLARDVEDLTYAGVGVEVSQDPDDGRRTYRLRRHGYSPGELALTGGERKVLMRALATFARDFPYSVPLHLALYNLMDVLEAEVEGAPVELPYDEELGRTLAKLDVAVSRRRTVAFDYYAISADKTSNRKIQPYALSLIGGSWYVTGLDLQRQDVRQFRLSRIRGKVTYAKRGVDNEYEIPDLDPARYGPRAPWQLDEANAEASVLVSREQGELLERMYPGAGELQLRGSKAVYVSPYSEERQLVGTILSLGEGARVLAPQDLVERTRECLGSLAALHAPGGADPATTAGLEVEETGSRGTDSARGGEVKPNRPELELALARYAARVPIEEGRPEVSIPLGQIAEQFGSTEEEVQQALEAVIEVSDKHMPTIRYVIDGGSLVKCIDFDRNFRHGFRLSALQGRAALLALDLIAETVDPDLLDGVREKVRRAAITEPQEIATDERSTDDPLIRDVHEACRRRRVLRIRYPSGGRVKQRDIEPAQMVGAHGSWYVSAYCRDALDTRLFRLDRILDTTVLDEEFAERTGVDPPDDPDDLNPKDFASGRATVRFSAEVARWMEGRPELEIERRYADGSEDYTLYYADLNWAASRMMLYRGEAVALEPEELRREIHRRSQALLDTYMEAQ